MLIVDKLSYGQSEMCWLMSSDLSRGIARATDSAFQGGQEWQRVVVLCARLPHALWRWIAGSCIVKGDDNNVADC